MWYMGIGSLWMCKNKAEFIWLVNRIPLLIWWLTALRHQDACVKDSSLNSSSKLVTSGDQVFKVVGSNPPTVSQLPHQAALWWPRPLPRNCCTPLFQVIWFLKNVAYCTVIVINTLGRPLHELEVVAKVCCATTDKIHVKTKYAFDHWEGSW